MHILRQGRWFAATASGLHLRRLCEGLPTGAITVADNVAIDYDKCTDCRKMRFCLPRHHLVGEKQMEKGVPNRLSQAPPHCRYNLDPANVNASGAAPAALADSRKADNVRLVLSARIGEP